MKTENQATIFICPVNWRHHKPTQLEINEGILALSFNRIKEQKVGTNTAIIKIDETDITYQKLCEDGSILLSGSSSLNKVISGIRIESTFRDNMGIQKNSIPLFMVLKRGELLITYFAVLFFEFEIFFLNSNPTEISVIQNENANFQIDSFYKSLGNYYKNKLLLNNRNFYKKFNPNDEIEYKLNLHQETDIIELIELLYNSIKEKRLESFILQSLDPFPGSIALWESENHLFEVLEPESGKGYISFIRCPNNEYIIKRKLYQQDSLIRKETVTKNVTINNSINEYIEEKYSDFILKKLPPFVRIKYDIIVESLETGNIYCISFDYSSIKDTIYPPLVQCEIEYIITRTVGEPINVLKELEEIYNFVKNTLSKYRIKFEETFYSKLSYLRTYLKNN